MNIGELRDAWRANCDVNYRLLDLCDDADFELKPGKGKTIRSNFVHIVSVRRSHLEERMREETQSLPKLDWKTACRDEILAALRDSDELVERALVKQDETGKPARWTSPLFYGYCVAHEAHHRSQIEITLRLNGREPADEKLYDLWNWSRKSQS